MRMAALAFALVLSVSGLAIAQEWDEYVNTKDGFKVNFPGQPKVTETTWKSQMEYTLPARVYSADRGREHYSITVVDYSGLEQQGIERSKNCPPGNQQCRANAGPIIGQGYWKQDERGAIVYATFKLLQRNAKLTSLAYDWQDMVEGQSIQLTNNADQSRTFASIYMHENRLIIMEATVPKGYPPPASFTQSLGWLDESGKGIRYSTIYVNAPDVPKPPIRGAIPPNPNGDRIDGAGANGGRGGQVR